jgi:hypothetical protein
MGKNHIVPQMPLYQRGIFFMFRMKIRSSVHINNTCLQNIICKQYEIFLFMSKSVHSSKVSTEFSKAVYCSPAYILYVVVLQYCSFLL